MLMINIHYQLIQDLNSVLIAPLYREKGLYKPEDIHVLQKHPKSKIYSKGIEKVKII